MKMKLFLAVVAFSTGLYAQPAIVPTTVTAELVKRVDTKNASVGDPLLTRTIANATLYDGTKIPRGTQLVCHITDAHAKSSADPNGHLAFSLDKAILRDGTELPLHGLLAAVAGPAMPQTGGDDGFPGETSAASGGNRSGSDIGGVNPAGSGGLNSNGGISSRSAGTGRPNLDDLGNATRQVAGAPVTNVPGVTLVKPESQTDSGSLRAKGSNFTLEAGAKLTFVVTSAVR